MSQKRKPDSEQNEASECEIKKGKPSTSTDTARLSSTCTLDSETQELIEYIFDDDMFKEIVENFDLDLKKMPLDSISIPMIDKAFGPLEKMEKAIKEKNFDLSEEHRSKYVDIIPHKTPPVLRTEKSVQEQFDLLNILADIEIAQKLKKDVKEGEKVKHPLDIQYDLLNSEIKLMDTTCKEYKIITKYIRARRGNLWRGAELKNIWTVNRQDQESAYTERTGPTGPQNRRLVWHCPNVASTAAILKTGLHVKPHQGRDFGHGIYFHDAVHLTAVPAQGKGILFLCEVALGNPYKYTHCGTLNWTSPPEYYDSLFVVGHWGPAEKSHTTIQLDGNDVAVPNGKIIKLNESGGSYSSQFVIYNEDQYRIRYILLFDNV